MTGHLHRLRSVLSLLETGDDRPVDTLHAPGRRLRMRPEGLGRGGGGGRDGVGRARSGGGR